MSLGARMFLLLGSVIVALLAAEWWLVTSLREQMREESVSVALAVGRSVLGALEDGEPAGAAPAANEMRSVAPRLELVDASPRVASDSGEPSPESPHDAASPPFARLRPMIKLNPALPAAPADPAAAGTSEVAVEPGVRHIPIPTERIEAIGGEFQVRVLLGSLGIMVIGLIAVGFVARRITRPLRGLELAATAVGEGRFGAQAPAVGEPSVDATIDAFNRMSTRLAELDAQVRRSRERAHLTEIGEIARGFAHSLRNPLNAIGLSIQELAVGADAPPDRDAVIATCRAQIERIDRTLRSFLALSTLGDREPHQVDVADIAEDVAMEAAQAAGDAVRVELESMDVRPRLAGFAPELRSALQVLVENAVEAVGVDGAVSIRVLEIDDGARIEVVDDGPGLPDSVRERLFQPHVTTKEHGAGLGLFLAERIATRRYRGGLALEDREPRGTRAILELRNREGGERG